MILPCNSKFLNICCCLKFINLLISLAIPTMEKMTNFIFVLFLDKPRRSDEDRYFFLASPLGCRKYNLDPKGKISKKWE